MRINAKRYCNARIINYKQRAHRPLHSLADALEGDGDEIAGLVPEDLAQLAFGEALANRIQSV
jgi:hypothetical protein